MALLGGRHKSATDDKAARRVYAFLQRQPGVKKITLGFTRNARSKWPDGTCRVAGVIQGGIRLLVYGSRGFADTYVYTDGPADALRQTIEDRWPETVA